MLTLRQGDRNGGISVVEDPRDAVGRLARVDGGEREVVGALATLGTNRLRALEKETKAALRQAQATERASTEPPLSSAPRVVARARSFGD